MKAYIVKDWAGNIMDWKGNPYKDEWEAEEAISLHAQSQLSSEGLDIDTEEGEHEYHLICDEYEYYEIEVEDEILRRA